MPRLKSRILIANRPPPDPAVPTARMAADVAEYLAELGHEVVLAVGSGTYVRSAGDSASAVGNPGQPKMLRLSVGLGRFGRLAAWAEFWVLFPFCVLKSRWDVVVVLTDPPFLVYWLGFLRRLRLFRGRGIWWTMDLYPEALSSAGLISADGPITRVMRWVNGIGVEGVDLVVSLGPRQAERIESALAYRKHTPRIAVVPPWDLRELRYVPDAANPLRDERGWRGKKVALYAGNLGQAHTFQEFVDAASILANRGDSEWVLAFYVRGKRVKDLQAAAQGLPNVEVSGYLPQSRTAELLSAASVHLVSVMSHWEGIVVPSKLSALLCTRAPILVIGEPQGDTGRSVSGNGRGMTLRPGSSGEAIAEAIKALSKSCTGHPAPQELEKDKVRMLCQLILKECEQ